MKLPREPLKKLTLPARLSYGADPIYTGMPSPWHLIVACMARSCSKVFLRETLKDIFYKWPNPAALANADVKAVRGVLKGYQSRRIARGLIEFSKGWLRDDWHDLRDLKGISVYTCDWVAAICFECKDAPISGDKEILDFVLDGNAE